MRCRMMLCLKVPLLLRRDDPHVLVKNTLCLMRCKLCFEKLRFLPFDLLQIMLVCQINDIHINARQQRQNQTRQAGPNG